MGEKPSNLDEYKKWLFDERKLEISKRTRTYYESVVLKVKKDYESSKFWTNLGANLPKYHEEYLLKTGYPLLADAKLPELELKGFDSFLLKTFRKNIIENKNYPEPPTEGWITSTNWFSRINDCVRTTLLVKYLDGVEFLKEAIRSLCGEENMEFKCFLEAREEGYYAAHLYTINEFEIPAETWDTIRIPMHVEIQITTQLKIVIKNLLHKYFEERRKKVEEPSVKWQWDYRSDEFIANYLGHILHYVEGMIMEVRDKQTVSKQ